MQIAIIKYGMGNVASVEKSLLKLGYKPILTDNKTIIQESDFIVLPGVGSFQKAMENLRNSGLADLLTEEVVVKKKPFLGICLGMQLLASYGSEPNKVAGLGWISGKVEKIETSSNLRIPHLGWNNVYSSINAPDYRQFDGKDFYFIHSYHFRVENKENVVLWVDYDNPIVAAIQFENIHALQFHPEKSQEAGILLLRKIINQYA